MIKRVVLKEGKEKSVLKKHPWIFSGAIHSLPDFEAGDILPIYSFSGEFLAQGYFHPNNTISGRILSFDQKPIQDKIKELIQDAINLRKKVFHSKATNAYRLINAEGDGIPGLIVDQYDKYLVIQVVSAGIEKLKPLIVDILIKLLNPTAIFEKSLSSSRREEGLEDVSGFLYGPSIDEIEILENELRFIVSLKEGQKTGFFLDQREMRFLISQFSKGLKVLNCFSYTGAFSAYALRGKAAHVDMLEIDQKACLISERNMQVNGFSENSYQLIQGDAFDYLTHEPLNYDLIILDPPAFAKKRKHVDAAVRGYREINHQVLKKIPKHSFLLTCSCSQHINDALFEHTILQAASKANRTVKVLSRHIQAQDHPTSLFHPEGNYLKSLFMYIE